MEHGAVGARNTAVVIAELDGFHVAGEVEEPVVIGGTGGFADRLG